MFSSVQIVVCGDDLNGAGGDLHPGQPTSGQVVPKSAYKNAPSQRNAMQMHEIILRLMYWEISPSLVYCPLPRATIFLIGQSWQQAQRHPPITAAPTNENSGFERSKPPNGISIWACQKICPAAVFFFPAAGQMDREI